MFTQVRSADRRVAPVEGQNHKSVMKAVYVVLEPQYQNALTQAATAPVSYTHLTLPTS